jgi:hypothetical protein
MNKTKNEKQAPVDTKEELIDVSQEDLRWINGGIDAGGGDLEALPGRNTTVFRE